MSQMSQKDFKVTVIGGGVCGLACAIALQKAGVTVDLFEAAVSLPQLDAMYVSLPLMNVARLLLEKSAPVLGWVRSSTRPNVLKT